VSRRSILSAVLALFGLLCVLAYPGLRALVWAGLRAMGGGARSAVLLSVRDPGTLGPAAIALVKITLLLAPAIRMLVRAPRSRLLWIPFGAAAFVVVLGNAVPGVTGVGMWLVFVAAAVAAWFAVARVAVAFLLPWLVALEPLLGHSPLAESFWPPSRLSDRCAQNDGRRPLDFKPEYAITRYFGVTPLSDELALLTGERRSFWVRRAAAGTHLGAPLRLSGNFWQGCVRDGQAWLTARGRICRAAPAGDSECFVVPGPPAVELDYVDVVCSGELLYVSQLLRGGVVEFDPRTHASRWHPVIPGLNLQLVARNDGALVAITTSRLVVFDPRTDRVRSEQAAGIVAMGIDLCPKDDAVAIADFSGRVRVFDRAGDDYRFRAGVSLPAPRRIAFSPSCSHLVVTSGDDRHAYLLRRDDLQVVRRYTLGPGLRDVVFLDENTVAAADACTFNTLEARE